MEKKYEKKEFIKKGVFDIIETTGVLPFPTEIFPDNIQFIIKSLKENASFETQITGSTILFVASTIIGLSKKIIIKADAWEDTPNLWIAVVGKRGTMKTPATSYSLKPLVNSEKEFATRFEFDMSEYLKVPKKDRKEELRPKRRQRFSNDTTVEGLIDAMEYNHNGMGIYKDELNGFFEEMNRYKAGGNLEFYLSAFNGGVYVKNRKSYDPQTINDIYLSMLGSIQPEVLKEISGMQTRNGMLDRWLYTISDDVVPRTNDNEIPPEITAEYNMFVSNIINLCGSESVLSWLPGARNQFFEGVNEMEDMMEDENCDPLLFTYLSKMKTYFARILIVVCAMDNTNYIGIDHVNKAKSIIAYYVSTAVYTFVGFENQKTIDEIFKSENASTKKQRVIAVKKYFPSKNITEIAKMVGCIRAYASDVINDKR